MGELIFCWIPRLEDFWENNFLLLKYVEETFRVKIIFAIIPEHVHVSKVPSLSCYRDEHRELAASPLRSQGNYR